MKRTWTIIGAADVARSFAWYQTLLGLPKSAPAHDDFGQILDADGTVLLCLHQWGTHGHPPLTRHNDEFLSDRVRRGLNISQLSLGLRDVRVRVHEHRNRGRLGHKLAQQLKPLRS
jgi:hypothetical protein